MDCAAIGAGPALGSRIALAALFWASFASNLFSGGEKILMGFREGQAPSLDERLQLLYNQYRCLRRILARYGAGLRAMERSECNIDHNVSSAQSLKGNQ